MPPSCTFHSSPSSSPSAPKPSPELTEFLNFAGTNLQTIVHNPSSIMQLAAQAPVSSALHRAWRECADPQRTSVFNLVNRPRETISATLAIDLELEVASMALSRDGKQIAVGGKHGHVCVHNLTTGGARIWRSKHKPQNPETQGDLVTDLTERVAAVVWYADAMTGQEQLASAADICVRLWAADSGTEVGHLSGHVFTTTPGTGTGDPGIGKQPATGPCQCRHYLLDGKNKKARSGECLLMGHSTSITGIAVCPSAKLLASGCGNNMLKLWSLPDRQQLHSMPGHLGELTSLAFGQESERLYSGDDAFTIRVWAWTLLEPPAQTASSMWAWAGAPADPLKVQTSPPLCVGLVRMPGLLRNVSCLDVQGDMLVAVGTPMMTSNARICLIDTRRIAPPVDAAVTEAIIAARSRATDDGETDGGSVVKAVKERVPSWALRVQLATRIILHGGYGHLRDHFLDGDGVDDEGKVKPRPYPAELQDAFAVEAVEITPDASTDSAALAATSPPDPASAGIGGVRITERASGKVLSTCLADPVVRRLRAHVTRGDDKAGPPACTCKSDWGELVADSMCPVVGHQGYIYACSFARNGRGGGDGSGAEGPTGGEGGVRVVSCGKKEAIVYDAQRGGALALLRDCHPRSIDDVQAAGGTLVTRGGKVLKVWDMHTVLSAGVDSSSAALHTGHAQQVRRLVVHPRSRTVVSCSADLTAASWHEGDADGYGAGRAATYAGHDKPVRCCDVSPDGKLVATASEDRCVRVYDRVSGELLHRWRHAGRRVSENGASSVAWSPLGEGLLVSANGEGMDIAFWKVPPPATPPPRVQ